MWVETTVARLKSGGQLVLSDTTAFGLYDQLWAGAVQEDRRSHEDDDAVPLESVFRIAKREDGTQRTGRLVEGLLEGGDVQIGLATVVR